jgi:hypothetical protein
VTPEGRAGSTAESRKRVGRQEEADRVSENMLEVLVGLPCRTLIRAMRCEADGLPQVGRSARTLGVRVDGPFRDIPIFPGNTVRPGTGGMSVALDDLHGLPKERLPRSLGGGGRDPVFALEVVQLPGSLSVRQDRPPHAMVEPRVECSLGEYEAGLASTRKMWRRMTDV